MEHQPGVAKEEGIAELELETVPAAVPTLHLLMEADRDATRLRGG